MSKIDFITEKELNQSKEAIFSDIAAKAKGNKDFEAIFDLADINVSSRRENQNLIKKWLEKQKYIKSVKINGKGSFFIVVNQEFIETYTD